MRRDLITTRLTFLSARPYPTNLTELSNRPSLTTFTQLSNQYEARSRRRETHYVNSNLRAMTPPSAYRTTLIREHRLVSARLRFKSVPGHPGTPQTDFDLVGLLASTAIKLRALGIPLTSSRVRHCTSSITQNRWGIPRPTSWATRS